MQKESQQARPWSVVASSEQFRALPAEHQERARELYFQDNVMPRVPKGMEQRARALFDQDTLASAASLAPANEAGGIEAMDFAKEAGAGALIGTGSLVSGLGDAVRPDPQARQPIMTPNGEFMPLGDLIGKHVIDPVRGAIAGAIDGPASAAGEWLGGKGKALAETKSAAAKQALKASTPSGDVASPSTWSMGEDPSFAGYGLHGANLLGQFVPQAGAMLATRGRAVQTPAMMAVGGLQAGGAAGNETEERIAATADSDLQASSTLYQQLRQTMGEQEARQALTVAARNAAFGGAAPVGALGGLATQVALGPLQRAIGGSVGRRLAGSLAIEAPGEGVQEVAEVVEARRATNRALGEQRSLTAGTFADFTLGAMGGAGFSVAGTAASALGGEAKVSRPGLDLDAAIDAAIDEAFTQSERPDDSEQLARQSLDPANAQIQADQARPAVAGLQAVPGTTVQQDFAPTVVAEASVAPAAAPPAAQDAAQPAAREQPADNGTGVFRVPVEQIKVDPQAYQFSSKVDDKGTDKRLDAVAKWDDRRSGSVVLHRRADGSLYVADGHHRVALAKRLGQPAINAVILDEADGVDVPAARREAAMINISGGNAEALDVAKVFRDSAESPAEVRAANNLPANQATADGQALASLGDNVFGMVAAGQLDEKSGAAIGAGFSEPAQQEEAARVFQKIQPATAYQRELLVQEIRSAEFTAQQGEQPSLFGDDEQQVSLLQNRLAVLDKLRQALNADKRLFASLNDNADRAVQAGNTIATEANAQITEASKKSLAMLGRITTTPALNQMVNRASQRIAGGEPVAAVVRELKKEMIGYGQDATGARRTDSAGGQSPDRTGAVAGASQRLPALDANGADQAREPGPAREGARSAVQPTEDFQLGQQSETELADLERQQKERDKAEAEVARKADEAKKKADEAIYVKQQSESQAGNFTLGQNAEDSVTGQGGMFDSQPSLSELSGKPAEQSTKQPEVSVKSVSDASYKRMREFSPTHVKAANGWHVVDTSIPGLPSFPLLRRSVKRNPAGGGYASVESAGPFSTQKEAEEWAKSSPQAVSQMTVKDAAPASTDAETDAEPAGQITAAAAKTSRKTKKADQAQRLREHFTPGNILKSYGGGHDRVIAYTPAGADGRWSVTVRAVSKDGDTWVDVPSERERIHATQPDERELRAGPVERVASAQTVAGQDEPAAPSDKSASKKPAEKLENFGEKLQGKREYAASSLSQELTDEQINAQPLSKIWPANEIDAIGDKFSAAMAYAARAEIPAKPRKGYKLGRWVSTVKTMRELSAKVLNNQARARELMSEMSGLEGFANKVALLEAVDRDQWKRIGKVGAYPDAYGFADGERVKSPFAQAEIDGETRRFDGATSVADIVEAVNGLLDGAAQPKKMQFEIRRARGSTVFDINKVGDKEYRSLKTLPSVKEARAFIEGSHADLVAAWEAVKDSDNVKKTDVRGTENRPRTGTDHRNGKDVTPKQFESEFGFRGVEFGNWVGQGANSKERQGMLNAAYDALMDLAAIVGIPPKAISLNSSLGLAFGSRGKGNAAAHFEPGNLVINLTKTKGAGSLAHEWFHALDNYFSRRRGGEVPIARGLNAQETYRQQNFITYRPEPQYVHKAKGGAPISRAQLAYYGKNAGVNGHFNPANWHIDPAHPQGVRPEVETAFASLVQALNDSPMSKRSALNDKSPNGYWGQIIERAARAFENFTISKMLERGYHNDYLANVRQVEDFPRAKARYPYLLPEEVAPIAEAFDSLFGTIETETDEAGNVALFSRASGPLEAAGLSPSSVVTGKSPANPISVAQAEAAALAFLADYNGNVPLTYRIKKTQHELYGPAGSVQKIGIVKGAYHPGRGLFTLAADHLSDSADVRETLRHEILGHYGLDTFRPSDKQAFLEKIIESRGEPSLKAAWAHVDKTYGDMAELVKAEEVFAFLAEQDRGVIVKALDALRSSIVRLLRAVGYKRKVVTRAELLREVEVIAKGIRSGRRSYQGEGDGAARLRLLDTEPAVAAPPEQGRLGIDTEQQAAGIELPAETVPRKAQRLLQDKLNRFTVIREWLAERGVELGEDADVYRAEERMHSRFSNKAKDFREKTVQPLVEKIQQAGYAMEDVAQYLHAQHAQERNAQIARINRQMPDGGSGMSNAEAREILAIADQKLVRLANELRDITDRTRKALLDSGLIGKEQADAWQKAYQHYVPLKGGPDDKAAQAGTGKGLRVQHKTKRALGHKMRGEGEWIVENILADHERALLAAEKNTVAKHLLKMAMRLQQTDLDIMTVGQPEKRGVLRNQVSYEVLYKGRPVGAFDTLEGAQLFKASAPLSIGKAASPADVTIRKSNDPSVVYMASPMPAPNEAQVYIDGDIIRIQIKDDLLARAYGNMGADALGTFMRSAQALNRWFSSVYTGYNPEFLITNVIRDFTTGLANITGEEGALFAAKATKNYFTSFAALLRYASKGATDPWIRQYREDGGNTGAAYLSDLERLGADMQAEYAAYQGVMANLRKGSLKGAARAAGRKAFNATLRHLEALNEAGENAMRLALYRTAVEQGMTRNKAASMAKNTTVNFNRKGELGAQANALYLFFNAGVQGTTSLAHAHFKGKNRQQAWAVSGAMAALGYSLAMLVAGGEDDENEKTPDYTKERNLVIPLGDGKSLTIPVPYGYGFYFNVGRLLAEAQRTGKTDDMAWQLASSFAGEFTPFSGAVAGDEPDMLQTGLFLLPTMAQIPMAVATNRSSFGGPMYPENPNKRYEPDRLKMWRGTEGTWADSLAGALESVGADVSPETLKHMSRTFTGGAGNFVGSTIDAATLSAQGATPEVREVPFLRKFYRENGVGDARSRFWRYQGEARKAVEGFQRAVDAGDRERVQTIVRENRELIAMADVAKAFSEAAGAARDRVQQIRLGDLPIAEKRAQIQKIEEREAELYDRFVRVFKERAREK